MPPLIHFFAMLASIGTNVAGVVPEEESCKIGPGEDGLLGITKGCLDDINAELDPEKRAAMYFELGYVLNENGSHERGRRLLDEAIALQPDNVKYLQERAFSFSKLERFSEAMGDLNELLRINPDYIPAIGERASVYYRLGDFSAALGDYERAIALDGGKLSFLFGKAASLIQLDRFNESMIVMREIEKLPNSREAMKALTLLTLEKLSNRASE